MAFQLRVVEMDTRHGHEPWLQAVLDVRDAEHWCSRYFLAVSHLSWSRNRAHANVSNSLIPETKGKSLEEMDIIFGSVDADKRRADIEKEERAFEQGEETSVRSDMEKHV